MSDDTEWLRERPEIMEMLWEAARMGWQRLPTDYAPAPHEYDEAKDEFLSYIDLTFLRAAIRADVVRELAGDSGTIEDRIYEMHATIPSELGRWPAYSKLVAAETALVIHERAAAHAQGRAAGREEAAKMADAKAQELYRIGFCNVEASLADNIATAIRSLP